MNETKNIDETTLLKMQELIKTINYHNYNYYSLDNPTISDAEWDKLYDELLQLEKQTGIVFVICFISSLFFGYIASIIEWFAF